MALDWDGRFSPYARRATVSEIRELLKVIDRPGIISFAGGIPDPALFPTQLIADAHARVFEDAARAGEALQYSVSEGYLPLRQWIVGYMRGKGARCDADNVLITSGSQQALYLTSRLLLSSGDRVLTARPTYIGALQALGTGEPSFGLLSELSEPECEAKLAYAMPDFANPTGESFSLAEREAIIDGASRHDVIVIEDGAYSELRFRGAPAPSLLALDIARCGSIDDSRVIHCGTFSKTIIPGLRIGWVVAPKPVIRKLVLLKQANDLHTSSLTQMALKDVAERLPQSHVAMLCESYGARCDIMLEALAAHMPEGTRWSVPQGGMFIWVNLPEGIDATVLLEEAIGIGVAFVPGGAFFAADRQPNSLRLNFTLCKPEAIRDGIARLARLIAAKK